MKMITKKFGIKFNKMLTNKNIKGDIKYENKNFTYKN